jgi:uncharacterized protein YyaL (SSP411 family)
VRRALPLTVSLLAAALLWPSVAAARPFSPQPDDKPWTRGTLMPSFGLGGSFYRGGGGNLLVAAGLNYFVVNNLALGLNLRNFSTFLPSYYKMDYPGIEKQIPTNEFSMIPGVTVMLYRSYRFTPYIYAGVGPVFLNHKRGVVGEWNSGPGFLIGIGRRMALDIGVNFSMRFPGDKCDAAYSYNGSGGNAVFFGACGLRWGIRAGLVFGFGVGRQKRPAPPPEDPYYTPEPEPAPAPTPGYAPTVPRLRAPIDARPSDARPSLSCDPARDRPGPRRPASRGPRPDHRARPRRDRPRRPAPQRGRARRRERPRRAPTVTCPRGQPPVPKASPHARPIPRPRPRVTCRHAPPLALAPARANRRTPGRAPAPRLRPRAPATRHPARSARPRQLHLARLDARELRHRRPRAKDLARQRRRQLVSLVPRHGPRDLRRPARRDPPARPLHADPRRRRRAPRPRRALRRLGLARDRRAHQRRPPRARAARLPGPRRVRRLLQSLVTDQSSGKLQGRRPAPLPPPQNTDLVALRRAAEAQLDPLYDLELGGWGRKQKYPLAALDELSLLRARVFAAPDWQARALTTIAAEIQLIDPVWGGMYQYSVAGVWDQPHYEKIGAIQAGALESLARAHRRTGEARWRDAAHLQRRYVLGPMQHPDGGFFTSQDADLQRPNQPPIPGRDYYARTDTARRALGVPRIDEHRYADINGRVISALCQLHASVPGPDGAPDHDALTAALKAGERLISAHRDPRGGYRHDADDTGPLHLRDQAAVGRALLALYRVTGDERWLAHARELADFMQRELADPERGSFFAHTVDPGAVGVFAERRAPIEDNGMAARFLLELHRQIDHLPAPSPHADAAIKALRAVSDPTALKDEGRMLGQYTLALAEATFTPVDVTIVAKPGDPALAPLHRAALGLDDPRTIVSVSPPGARYPDIGAAAVYLCTDSACSTPIKDPAKLTAAAARFLATVQ